ncbi:MULTISPECIES: DoxX family protein [unclassified Frankia]|uniref:DoxX family protein n=1 Tax=unclassified Frankia TaxID=2632575 RepID=UPI002AD5741A|nr:MULTISPECIES: DoxX family protein [unclassified Frankia]
MTHIDTAILLIRLCVGLTLIAHGWNHLFGGGRIAGAAGWYGSMGLRPPLVQAWMSVLFEFAAGIGLAAGFLTPLAASAAVGLMAVAGVVAHRRNGFFVFREGYEYVLMIAVIAIGIATAGPGKASLDHAIGLGGAGWAGFAISTGVGLAGAAALLVTSWRPQPVKQ